MLQNATPDSLSAIDLDFHKKAFPSPQTWRDQVVYLLLPDRFSDGQEKKRPMYDRSESGKFQTSDKGEWMKAGLTFQGGTLTGITSKLDYLRNLGVTTLWIGPVLKQRPDLETYHGYGVQNFLDVDPRFGNVDDLVEMIDQAHKRGMYVILDIVINHTGNNWFYREDGHLLSSLPYRFDPPYDFGAWRTANGGSSSVVRTSDDGIWPREFQNPEWYTRAGQIERWDPDEDEDPLDDDVEFRRGDFYELKHLNFEDKKVLQAIVKVYQYWIGLIDCDGYRIDAVKHLPWEVSRIFCNALHEYAESIGKENFLLAGEVAGGEHMQKSYLDVFGRNLDMVLDIGNSSDLLQGMVKGFVDPKDFFAQYSGHVLLGSHRETGRYHISILDDHDMVRHSKQRFAAFNSAPNSYHQVAHAVGVQLTTLGIPCIYYGTEQSFDGNVSYHDNELEPCDGWPANADRYFREAMFGGKFGAFGTSGCHFFDPDHPTYLRISAIAKIRSRTDKIGLALRRGRQYLMETSYLDRPFAIPEAGELVAWTRVLVDKEVLIVLNTNGTEGRGADVTVYCEFHPAGSRMRVLYRGDWSDDMLKNIDKIETPLIPVRVEEDGRCSVRIDLPPGEMAILA